MVKSKQDRIEDLNIQIIKLILARNKAQRYRMWKEECSASDQITELEKQIKLIEAE